VWLLLVLPTMHLIQIEFLAQRAGVVRLGEHWAQQRSSCVQQQPLLLMLTLSRACCPDWCNTRLHLEYSNC
jgi:hypothetical protein